MIKTHRAAIRSFLGYRETTRQDEEVLVAWLCQEVLREQQQEDALLAAAYQHYQELHIEPPTPDRISRLLHTALHRFDEQFCASISQQLASETRTRLDALLTTILPEEPSSAEVSTGAAPDQEAALPAQRSRSAWQYLKQDAGQMSLEHTLNEIAKLERIEQLGLPATLFAQASPRLLQQYRQRIAIEEVHEIRRHPDALRWMLLAASCWLRRQEIIDTLVDLLIDMAHHLSTKAERRGGEDLFPRSKKKTPKKKILFFFPATALHSSDGVVC